VFAEGQHREQLVDLEIDPGEMRNVAADPAYAAELERHRGYMREWVAINHDTIAAVYGVK
jgi:choline-sulfatase